MKNIFLMLLIIAIMSCRSQTIPTNSAIDGIGSDTGITGEAEIDYTQFIGKLYRSKEAISDGNVAYLWIEVTATGLKYKADLETTIPTFDREYQVTQNAFQKNVANFTGYDDNNNPQYGTITFNTDGSVVMQYTGGTSYNGLEIIALQVVTVSQLH